MSLAKPYLLRSTTSLPCLLTVSVLGKQVPMFGEHLGTIFALSVFRRGASLLTKVPLR